MIANFDYNVDSSNSMYHLTNDIIIDSSGNAFVTDLHSSTVKGT